MKGTSDCWQSACKPVTDKLIGIKEKGRLAMPPAFFTARQIKKEGREWPSPGDSRYQSRRHFPHARIPRGAG